VCDLPLAVVGVGVQLLGREVTDIRHTNKQHQYENQQQKKYKHRNNHCSFSDSDGRIAKSYYATHCVHHTAHSGLWTRLTFEEAEYSEP
jgi:hypothetical protein